MSIIYYDLVLVSSSVKFARHFVEAFGNVSRDNLVQYVTDCNVLSAL